MKTFSFQKAARLITISSLKLLLYGALFIICVNAQSSRYSQETTDAIQNQEISMLKVRADSAMVAVDKLIQEQASMRSAMDRFTGIGIGFGATLTLLQVAQLIFQIKRNQQPR
ncbi:MAG TPA: hypothetical protein VL329_04635 [Nitrospiraceae bacterium]|jgi:hypothetical protein|nr:hypothetical protein [Nitrospiraceae bacterium]